MRSELTRQKSQNSTSTGLPRCWSIRSEPALTQGSFAGNGGAVMVSTGGLTAAGCYDGRNFSPRLVS